MDLYRLSSECTIVDIGKMCSKIQIANFLKLAFRAQTTHK